MTRDRYSTIVLGERVFETVIDSDDKHWWQLLDPREQAEFDKAWAEMAERMQRRAAA